MPQNYKTASRNRALQELRALRYLIQNRRVTAAELGRAILRNTFLPQEESEWIGHDFGKRLCAIGRATVSSDGVYELRKRLRNSQGNHKSDGRLTIAHRE